MDRCPHCMTPTAGQICPVCGKSTYWQAPTSQLPVGTLLQSGAGHVYQLGAAKGQGGFGITYAAMDLRTNTRVAVKEYFPSHCAGRDTMTRVICATGHQENFATGLQSFLQEAKMLSSVGALDSVVSVRDFFESNGTAYIVMEYVDGNALNDVVAARGRMRREELFPILKPLLRDLAILHRAGVIHRDISPDNLILTREGKLKLLDFGAARSTSGGKAMTVMLKTGFSPLEQYQSKGQGAYTDVYAMAGTIYYCLTGRVPPASVDRIQEDELRAPNDFGAGLTRQEQDALVWGLSVHAHQRPQNMEAFANALLSTGAPVFEGSFARDPQTGYGQQSTYTQTGYGQQGTYTQTGYGQPGQSGADGKRGFGKGLIIGIAAAVAAVALLIGGLAIGGVFGGKKSPSVRDRDEDDRPASSGAGASVTVPEETRPAATKPQTELLRSEEGYLYYIEGGAAVIAGYDGGGNFLSFPDELDGCPVSVLDVGCLKGNTEIQTVLLPMDCTEIRADAFSGCSGLRQMYCYSSIAVDPTALLGCDSLRAVVRWEQDDVSSWRLPASASFYIYGSETGIGTLSTVWTDDRGVVYAITDSEEAAIVDVPAGITALTVPENHRGYPVRWMSKGALDGASAELSVDMCPDMAFDISLLYMADWDSDDVDAFCWNWYFTCIILDGINQDLTGRQLVPDRIAVEAAMIRARELEEYYDFNIRPDGTDTPDLLDGMGLEWTKATIWDGTVDTSNDETYDQEFEQVFADMIEQFSGTHSEGYYYEALGAAVWWSETDPTVYVYGIGIIR